MREAYDGQVIKRFGNGEDFIWRGKLGLIAGVTRVDVALDFELTVPIWVADRNPQTRERIPSHRVTQVIE